MQDSYKYYCQLLYTLMTLHKLSIPLYIPDEQFRNKIMTYEYRDSG